MIKKSEILSPASNMKHINTAIKHKADAVYGGLKKWNARNKAINFTDEEYNLLIELLHQHNIKFYLTLNILMLDDEIQEVVEFLKHNKLPDSFIVADIGLIQILKKEFPNVPLHFSTQFGAHCVDDVNYISYMGGSRAVLARELTSSEINKIRDNSDIELETFIWGSQCLSFSGLCFFGSLINGGAGNRGKCIITCRDVYSINNDKGHYLYVPDMDCTNSITELNNIDCLKIEGRRRDPQELANILDVINQKIKTNKRVGYYYGTTVGENNQYEKINTRIQPLYHKSELLNVHDADVFVEFDKNNTPIQFSTDLNNPNVKYVYSEIKKGYELNKKNITLDFTLDKNEITEILYVNHKGEGHTFFKDDSREQNIIPFQFNSITKELGTINKNINLYKMRYKRTIDDLYIIDQRLFDELIHYITDDCEEKDVTLSINEDFKIQQVYLETTQLDIIDKYLNDKFVKIIYNISSVGKFLDISKVVEKYGDRIIYKLPMFNWKSLDLTKSYLLLEGKEVMFTRLSQLYVTKNIRFKRKYADYTIYTWNRVAINYLKEFGIDEFTASPELSYPQNKTIFSKDKFQVILGGKLALVYTRGCFGHILGCNSCVSHRSKSKIIKNEDKNLNFDIRCEDDYRMLFYQYPILNDYSKIDVCPNTLYRYVTSDETPEEIDRTLTILKGEQYYKNLKKEKYWVNSYECNLIEGRD